MMVKHVGRIYFGIVSTALLSIALFVLFDLVPFPGDFMRAWYEPWRTETVIHGVPTIPHKAVGHDVFRQIYPFKELSMDLLKLGLLPLWNPYNGSGQPLLAAGIQTVFNPVMGIFFIVNPETAWTVLYVGQFAAVAASFILFVSGLGVSFFAALISCVVLLGSSFIVANSLFGTFLYSFAGLPLLLWCVDEIRRGKVRGWNIFPLAIMWTVLTGFPQLTMYIFVVVGSYGIFRLRRIHSWKFWLKLMLYGTIGIGLTAVQLIPQYELYRLSAIDTSSSAFIFRTFLMPVSHMVSLIVPNFFGNPATYNYWGYADYIETAVSVGSIAVYFAIVGVFVHERKQHALTAFFVSLGIGGSILALRSPLTEWLYRLPIPILTTGVPTRSLGIVTFALCVLSAFGIDAYLKKIKGKFVFLSLGAIWLVLACIVTVVQILNQTHVSCNNPVITSCFSVAFRNSLLEIGVFTALVGSAVLSRMLRGQFGRVIFVGGVLCLVLGAGVYNAYKFIPFTHVRNFMPEHPLLTQLKSYAPERIAYQGTSIPTDLATYYRFFDTNYYSPLYIRRYGELVSYVNTGNPTRGIRRSDVEVVSDATVSAELSFRRNRFWDMTGSGILVAKKSDGIVIGNDALWEDAHWRVSKRSTALPRAYLVNHVVVPTGEDWELSGMFSPETDIRKTAFIEDSRGSMRGQPEDSGAAIIRTYSENRIVIDVEAKTPAFLVFSDTYFPGWKASIDGADAHIYRTNYAFRGVSVPKGSHSVEFRYEPYSFKIGVWLTGVSMVLWFALIWATSRKRT